MANPEHLEILKQGVEVWNHWRDENRKIRPDLSGANLSYEDLNGVNLNSAELFNADLRGAELRASHLIDANLSYADLSNANLSNADLRGAHLNNANLIGADLFNTHLSEAYLLYTNLNYTNLRGTKFNNAHVGNTAFINIDLSKAIGLDIMEHSYPSEVGINTIYLSQGQIPEKFLLGCGIPEAFITQIPALVGAVKPIQFHSCFISYSSKDEEFARRLHAHMREASLRVWYAPEEVKGGQKLHEQIFRAIQMHDKLLLVLSKNSLHSQWVMTEIRRAKKVEREENHRKLFPIRLVDFATIQKWECFDADSGKDLAVEVREYFIPDFSNWKDKDSFDKAFDRLLRDLKSEEKKP